VTSILAKYAINVAFMRVSRQSRGAEALMILEVDDVLTEAIVAECQMVDELEDAFCIPAI
jgi:L-serine dehydratase